MAVIPIWWGGAEFGAAEANTEEGATITDLAAYVRTGAYAFRMVSTQRLNILPGGAYTQWRFFMPLLVPTIGASGPNPAVVSLASEANLFLRLHYHIPEARLFLTNSAGTELASGDFTLSANTYYLLTLDVNLAVAGWVYLYVDGVLIGALDMDMTALATSMDRVRIGALNTATGLWATGINVDDLVLYDTTGESSPAPAEDIRLAPFRPNAVGNDSGWTPNGAGDNYTKVNEIPPNDDTTYVSAQSAGLRDSYGMGSPTLPEGLSVIAVSPIDVSKKSAAMADVSTRRILRLGGAETLTGPRALNTLYRAQSDYIVAPPGGGSWSQDAVNDLEVGIVSAGVFE